MAFMGTESASSSSSSTISGFKYDVFLSFRGSDTRKNFTDHLYAALNQKGIFTFRDDEKLERGTFIAPELLRAIEESRFAVVIISQDYASSSWCLVELAKIVECMEKGRLMVLPVFHYIDPSDVRNLRKTFGEAFAKYEERDEDNIEEVHRWKAALTKVAKIAGWDLRDKHEPNVIEEIVRKLLDELTSIHSIVHKDFVGINSRMEELVNLLGMGLNDVRFIGIWGMGGLGKTTLARVVYDRFRHQFEGSSFLANVREECRKHGLAHLKKKLLFDILIESNIDFSDVQWGSNVIEKRLCYKSVLIVLDDVGRLDQLEALAGERVWFGRGSRVIITTRYKRLLIKHDLNEAEIYEAKKLNSDEALQLFSRKAFKKDHPSEGYVKLSKKAICYAQGLPLALDVLGSFLKCREPDAWESALGRLKEAPQKKILDTFQIGFDGLEETEKKIKHLTELETLNLLECKNLGDLPDSIYKLQELPYFNTLTAKLRPKCDSSDGSSRYWFKNLKFLSFHGYEGIIELDLLMKPDYFPKLETIDLSNTNIVTIPESISRFPRLIGLYARDCKLLREIQGLPQSIRIVSVDGSMLLNTSPSGLFNQVIGIIGILPNRVCGRARSNKLMDLQISDNFPSETEGAESEDGDISMDLQFSNNFPSETEELGRATKRVEFWGESFDRPITFLGTEMLKWFNHLSVDNSIFFSLGRNFPKLVVCIVPGPEGFVGFVEISINGFENREYQSIHLPGDYTQSRCSQHLFSLTQWSLLQRHLNESNPTDQNVVKVSIRHDDTCSSIKMWGVHVECTCPPQESDDDDVGDYWRKFSCFDFFPSQEYKTLPKHLKRLFLYCSLFPLGYEFGKEEMVQLWIAEGFIEERQRMEDTGCEYFDNLVRVEFIKLSRYDYSVDFYSFLSDEFDSNGGKKLYKVNEAQVSHLKMAISEGSYQSVLGDKLDVASELTRHLSLPCESINDQMAIETLKRCTNLHTLLLLSGCGYNVKQVPRDLFLSLKLLRTLNLSRTLISELPSSIGNVKSLRYLDVSNTHIRRLPESIDFLSNLQTLKLRGCLDFVALPKNMKKLTNLRHLELDIVRQLISMPNRIGNLTNLQTLSAFLVGRDDECGIEELKNMNDLCGTFCISRLERVSSLDKAKEAALKDKMYLHKLELRWSDIRVVNPGEEEEILESLRPHLRLREIQILFYGGIKIPSWICDPSFADLVSITLYKCSNCEFLPSLGDLPSLKFLFIREMNEVKKIDQQFYRNGSDKGFAKLEKLEINVMLSLEKWIGVENGDLPVLRKLTVEYLPELIALPSLSCLNSLEHLEIKHCSNLQCLPNEGLPTSLEFLLIKDCPELKERCCKEKLDWGKIEHVPNIWIDHQEISSS